MENVCRTTYICVGNKKELETLHNIIKENAAKESCRDSHGLRIDLDDIITQLGYDCNKLQFPYRGCIRDFYMKGNTLVIIQATLLVQHSAFRRVIEQEFPGIEVFSQEISPSNKHFITDSFEYFPERYCFFEEERITAFLTLETAARYISSRIGRKITPTVKDINLAIDKFMADEGDTGQTYDFCEIISLFDLVAKYKKDKPQDEYESLMTQYNAKMEYFLTKS